MVRSTSRWPITLNNLAMAMITPGEGSWRSIRSTMVRSRGTFWRQPSHQEDLLEEEAHYGKEHF